MFKLSLSSKELFHSNFLEWLSNVDREAFVLLINKMAGLNDSPEWPVNWRVKREYHNFDLCVVAYDESVYKSHDEEGIEDEDNLRILFVVENKVKSIPYEEQLERYAKEAKELNDKYWKSVFQNKLKTIGSNTTFDCYRYENNNLYGCMKKGNGRGKKVEWTPKQLDSDLLYDLDTFKLDTGTNFNLSVLKGNFIDNKSKSPELILLSLATEFPNKEVIKKSWKICSYCFYQRFIKECYLDKTKDLFHSLIEDYCGFVESLSFLSENWKKDYEEDSSFLYDSNSNYQDAKAYRIHDLYQKLKFSFLCTKLYDSINKSYGIDTKYSYTVFPSNLGGLFKEVKNDTEGRKKEKDSICVNYTYLHGDPLLEINVHPACRENNIEYYYAIQVQGNAYERGIQVKKIPNAKYEPTNKGKDDIAKYVWEVLLPKGQVTLIKDWMTVGSSSWEETGDLLKDFEKDSSTKGKDYNAYNMSDGAYLYQKKRINNNASIKVVIDKMLKDLDYVIKNLKPVPLPAVPTSS